MYDEIQASLTLMRTDKKGVGGKKKQKKQKEKPPASKTDKQVTRRNHP